MATMQGLTGKLSGKMGSAVFRVRDGQQVVTQYNPVVKNPNSEGQQAQRAKFKLMSQLAAVMGPGFGTLGVTKRKAKGKQTQRNAFTQLNFPLAAVTSDNEVVTATIPMEQLKLTSSFRYLPSMDLSPSAGAFSLEINGIPADVTTIRVVIVNYPNNTPSIQRLLDIPVNAENHNVSLTFSNLKVGRYTALAYGLIPSESAKASIDLDNIHTSDDEAFISAVQLNAMVADGSMVETMTVGANVTVTE